MRVCRCSLLATLLFKDLRDGRVRALTFLTLSFHFNYLQALHTVLYEQYTFERFVVACTTHREQVARVNISNSHLSGILACRFQDALNSVDADHQ